MAANPADEDRLLSVDPDELRSYLPVSRTTIYGLVASGQLTRVKIGRRSFIRLSEVQRLITEGGC